MCGRFTLTQDIQTVAHTIMSPRTVAIPSNVQVVPRYNIAPTQDVVTVINDGELHLDMLRWGLIPSWSKEEKIGSRMINACAETLAEKPSFKRLLHNRRCLVVADGFYEWIQEPGTKSKTPMYMTLKSGEPFALAGLWDSWRSPDGQQIRTCTIITTEPNELLATIHNRMPAILKSEAREMWLDPSLNDEHALLPLLTSYNSDEMTARPVSRLINDPRSTYNPLTERLE
jgi:putative SOS response-associated peptidase YedK